MKRLALALVLAAALSAVPAALADGDPASDYLLGQPVFLPFDAKIPQADQARLMSVVQNAKQQGYTIRVALIWTSYDLGSIPELMGQPQNYAHFLGVELSFLYKGRLLVVMPNGFGYHYRKPAPAQRRLLASIHIVKTPAGIAQAAITAVERLAAQAGYTVRPGKVTTQAQRNGQDRIVIIAAVVAALLVGTALRFVIRRRARGS